MRARHARRQKRIDRPSAEGTGRKPGVMRRPGPNPGQGADAKTEADVKNRFDEALLLQDACNPSGVAHTLIRMFDDIRKDPEAGTDTLRRDPAVRCTVAKLADLCGLDYTWPRDAHEECERLR